MIYFKSLIVIFVSINFAFGFESKIDDLLYKYNTFKNFHGNVLVKQGDRVLYEKSLGVSQAEWNVGHNKHSRFMIASLSKSFTATLLLILEKEGALSIEDPVANYIQLPEGDKVNKQSWKKLKIKHLMNHTGGIRRDFRSTKFKHRSSYSIDASDLINPSLKYEDPFLFMPGEKFYYSNYGYVFLANIIENVTKKSFGNVLRIKILEPLKLKSTGEYHRSKKILFMSSGYFYNEDERLKKRCCDDASSLRGAAGLYSDVQDMMLWLETLFAKNSSIYDGNISEKLLESLIESEIDHSLYGYGLIVDTVGKLKRIHHSGHEYGYVSSMSWLPVKDIKIIVLSNRQSILAKNEAGEIAEKIALILQQD